MEDKIKKSELGKILRVSERSIDSHVEEGILPIPSYPTYPETEMLFDRASISKVLGIKEIPDEPFIESDNACKILGVAESSVHHLARKGKIPSYRLKNSKGHKFLFLRSELEALMQYSFEWNVDFANTFSSQLFFKAIFDELLEPGITKDLTEKESRVIKEVIINKKSFEAIGKESGLTRERIRQLFQRACKRIYYRVKEIPGQLSAMDSLVKENADLRSENKILKSLIDKHKLLTEGQIDVLKIKIEDLDFSVRTLKIFQCADIFTIGDIVKFTKSDMLKFRNFGVFSLMEVEKALARYNLKLAPEKVFLNHVEKYKV